MSTKNGVVEPGPAETPTHEVIHVEKTRKRSIKELFNRFKNAKRKIEVRVKIGTQVKDFTFEEFSERTGIFNQRGGRGPISGWARVS